MMQSRTRAVLAMAVLMPLAAACNDDSTGSGQCRAIFAGRVTTTAGAGLANATVTVRDTLVAGGVPVLTATTDAGGNFGAVLNSACPNCGASVTPPAQYQLPAGQPARKAAPLACNATVEVNFTLERTGEVVD